MDLSMFTKVRACMDLSMAKQRPGSVWICLRLHKGCGAYGLSMAPWRIMNDWDDQGILGFLSHLPGCWYDVELHHQQCSGGIHSDGCPLVKSLNFLVPPPPFWKSNGHSLSLSAMLGYSYYSLCLFNHLSDFADNFLVGEALECPGSVLLRVLWYYTLVNFGVKSCNPNLPDLIMQLVLHVCS